MARRSAAEAAEAERIYLGLVRDYESAILNYIWRRVGDPDLAEDLTQETFVKAWRALDRMELGDGVEGRRRAWLYTIAHNAIADHGRRQRRIRWLSLDAIKEIGGGNPARDVADRDPLQRALDRLTADQREVLLLFSHEGLPAEDVARILGITPAAARKRRQRAREAFADAWVAIGERLPDGHTDGLADAVGADGNGAIAAADSRPLHALADVADIAATDRNPPHRVGRDAPR